MTTNLSIPASLRPLLFLSLAFALALGSTPVALAFQEGEQDGGNPWQVPFVDSDGDPTTDGYRAEQVIVRLRPGADLATFNARNGTTELAAIPSRSIYLLQLPSGSDEATSEGLLGVDPDVVWAELNFASQAPEGRPRNFFVTGASDETSYTGQYASDLLGLDAAHACGTGSGVVVAVIDTGVDAAHPALAGRVLGSGWNVFENSPDTSDVGNGVDDDDDGSVDEMTGHGTHVSGIIGQVAPDTAILPVKALDSDGVGDAFFLAAGIYYAIDSGASVINLSLSSTQNTRVVAEAVAEAASAGIVVTAAAGNLDRAQPPEYPAVDDNALGVAATDASDLKSAFSNYQGALDISAPGTDIVSAIPGGGYAYWSGTSMATPFVSGAAALVIGAGMGGREQLVQTAAPLDGLNPSYAGLLGAGRVDAAAAVGCGTSATTTETSESTTVTSETTETTAGTAVIAGTGGDGANCRVEANSEAELITVVPEGTTVDLAGDLVGEWQPITCDASPGYVHSQYLSYD
ncbi:MAG: S8 family serine peptidase [Chloroflexota bacterium]|nr:S8 family serine peptidase [Chloroflexota bacterium]